MVFNCTNVTLFDLPLSVLSIIEEASVGLGLLDDVVASSSTFISHACNFFNSLVHGGYRHIGWQRPPPIFLCSLLLSASFFLLLLDLQVYFFLTSFPERTTLEQNNCIYSLCNIFPSLFFILLHTVILCLANSTCFFFQLLPLN